MEEQLSFQRAQEAVAVLKRTEFDIGAEKGGRPRTALEWLAWRDGQLFMLENMKEGIAQVMPTRHYGVELPDWWRRAAVEGMALCFRRAEFMVWGEPQWQEVLRAAPSFEGSSLQVPAHCWQIWTWPGDRKAAPGAQEEYGLPPGFALGAMVVSVLPLADPQRALTARAKATEWGWVESVGASGSHLLENFLASDCTAAF